MFLVNFRSPINLLSNKRLPKLGSGMASPKITLTPILFFSFHLFISILVCSKPFPASADLAEIETRSDNLSAYTVLEQYGFPKGLLPQSVRGYTLNDDGSFAIFLEGSCSFNLESGYSLKYRETITGQISTGALKKLKGVSVKVFLFWLTIDEIIREGDDLEFYVGVISASFPIDNFLLCPQCGCGLDCFNGDVLRAEA